MALVWLLDITAGGRTLRASTRPVSYTEPTSGRTHQYEGTLDGLEFPEALGIGGDTVSARQVTVDVLPSVDLAALASYGHDLASGTATLRLWDDTEPAYRAETYMSGARVTIPDYGGAGEVLSFELSAEPFDDAATVLPDAAEISSTTWAAAPESSENQAYPMAWGQPGEVSGIGALEILPGSPAYPVESVEGESFLLANAAVVVDSRTGAYTLITMAAATSNTLYTGMEVEYADNGGAGIPELTDGDTYFVELVNETSQYYALYQSDEMTDRVVLSNNTPDGVETFEIVQPYATKLIISGEPVVATTATVFPGFSGDYWPTGFIVAVVQEADLLGRAVSTVSVAAIGAGQSSVGRLTARDRLDADWAVAWHSNPASYSSTTAGAVITVGQLLLELLRRSSVPIDWASWQVLASRLPYTCGYSVADPEERPLDLVLDIVAGLPVGLYSSAQGLAAVELPAEVSGRSVVKLVDGSNAHRTGALSAVNAPGDLASVVRARFAHDSIADGFRGRRSLRVDPRDDRTSTTSDVYMRASSVASRVTPQTLTVEADWTYTGNSARAVARWVARQSSVSPQSLSLDVSSDLGRALALGTPVSVTSEELSLSEAVGFVRSRVASDRALWEVEIYILDGVASDNAESPGGSSSDTPTGGTPN